MCAYAKISKKMDGEVGVSKRIKLFRHKIRMLSVLISWRLLIIASMICVLQEEKYSMKESFDGEDEGKDVVESIIFLMSKERKSFKFVSEDGVDVKDAKM